jgi:hypothetical protein
VEQSVYADGRGVKKKAAKRYVTEVSEVQEIKEVSEVKKEP